MKSLFENKTITRRLIAISFLAYAILFFLFYPAIYAYRDEANYLTIAYMLRSGFFFLPAHIFPMQDFVSMPAGVAPFYPLGNAIALIPFTLLGEHSVFLFGFFWHVIASFTVYHLARRFKIHPLLPTILYLFFPPSIFYSRTLMADVPTTAYFLIACYMYFSPKKPKWLAGLFFGMLLLFRATNVLLVVPFGLHLLYKSWRQKKVKDLITFVLPMLPFVVFFASCNWLYYGSPLSTGYTPQGTEDRFFSLQFLRDHIKHYLLNLNAMYPLMLIVFLFSKKIRKFEIVWLIIFLIVFFSAYSFRDRFPSAWLDIFFSNRFLLPILPFLILGYADVVFDFIRKCSPCFENAFVGLLLLGLILTSGLIQARHQEYLVGQKALKDKVYETTQKNDTLIYDLGASELLQAHWGKRNYIQYRNVETLRNALSEGNVQGEVYLVARATVYANQRVEGEIVSDLDEIKKMRSVQLVDAVGDLKVYHVL